MDTTACRATLYESLKHKIFSAPLTVMFKGAGECRSRNRPAMGIQNKLDQCPAGSKRPYTRYPGRSALTHISIPPVVLQLFYDTTQSVTDSGARNYDLGQFFTEFFVPS
jgi:hypothetical protein